MGGAAYYRRNAEKHVLAENLGDNARQAMLHIAESYGELARTLERSPHNPQLTDLATATLLAYLFAR
jgi:hypothetical protein